jgi:hypothetical protein
LVGRCDFKDEKNELTGYYVIGAGGPKNGPKDYFTGEILHKGQPVCKVRGNYMGYIEFDEVRYFDVRQMTNYRPIQI